MACNKGVIWGQRVEGKGQRQEEGTARHKRYTLLCLTTHSSEGPQSLVKLLGHHSPHQLEVWSALDAVNEQRDSFEIEDLHSEMASSAPQTLSCSCSLDSVMLAAPQTLDVHIKLHETRHLLRAAAAAAAPPSPPACPS